MRTRHRLGGSTLLMLLLLTPAAFAASPDVETSLSASEIGGGESVSLRIHLRGSLSEAEPDLAPLEASFDIVNIARSQRRSLVNGVYDASMDWEVTLLPKITGTLEIPALSVGSTSTKPLEVIVSSSNTEPGPLASSTSVADSPTPVSIRVSAERLDPYEQERVLLHVRLYGGADLLEGALEEPEIAGASVERLGEDQPIQEKIAGQTYRGVERTYAVFPDAPGELVVPSIRFDGLMRDDRRVRSPRGSNRGFGRSLIDDFFSTQGFGGDLFDRLLSRGSRRVVARSSPLTLNVRARPEASYGSWWLPVRDLSLDEDWEPESDEARVGETLTRRITLRAEGAAAAQLPPLALSDVSGAKQYAEAPRASETTTGVVRIQDATVIPTEPGPVTLPAIEVTWWDTRADAPRIASLPARTLEVLPAAAGAAHAPPSVGRPDIPPVPEISPATSETPPEPPAHEAWPLAVLVLGLLGVGAGVRSWIRWRAGPSAAASLHAAERALRRACRRSDPGAAELAVRAIASTHDPRERRFDVEEWAREVGGEALRREVAQLRAVRYSKAHRTWQGEGFWNAYRAARKRARRRPERHVGLGLPPLYPNAGADRDARGVV